LQGDADEKLQHSFVEAASLLGAEGTLMAQKAAAVLKQASRALPSETDTREAGGMGGCV
jgi:hypothetical protein